MFLAAQLCGCSLSWGSWFKEGTCFMNAAAAGGAADTREQLLKGHFIFVEVGGKRRKTK